MTTRTERTRPTRGLCADCVSGERSCYIATWEGICAEPLPRLCWYGLKDKPMVDTDAVKWHSDEEFVDIDFLTRIDQLVADGHLQSVGRRGPFTKIRGTVLSARKPTPARR